MNQQDYLAGTVETLAKEKDALMLRSVGAMAIAERAEGWEKVPIDCPMLAAVEKLRKDFDMMERFNNSVSRNIDRAYASGYDAGRRYVTNTLRDVLGIDKL